MADGRESGYDDEKNIEKKGTAHMKQSPFYAKLCELEQDNQNIQRCLHVSCSWSREELESELQRMEQDYEQNQLRLEEDIRDAHSPAVLKLARAQHTYALTIQKLMAETLPKDLHSESSTLQEDRSEAQRLYAEYAIDFARQAIRHALIAALYAMDTQWEQENLLKTNEEEASQ